MFKYFFTYLQEHKTFLKNFILHYFTYQSQSSLPPLLPSPLPVPSIPHIHSSEREKHIALRKVQGAPYYI